MSIANFQKTCQSLITLAVESLASAPHLTQVQQRSRGEGVVQAIMAFLPTEPVQVMLASQAVGHHLSLLDTFQQIINRALADTISVKMRTISTMETRMMLALVKELRTVRKTMVAVAETERSGTSPVAANASPPAAKPPVQRAAPATEKAPEPAPRPAPVPSAAKPETVDDATFAAHIADYENAWAALNQTLEEARALDKPTAAAAHDHLAAIAPAGLTGTTGR